MAKTPHEDPGRQTFGAAGISVLAGVGNIVLVWNELEHQMQILVSWFSGNTWETFVSTTKFHRDGSLATRMEKLAAVASAEAKPHMLQFAEGFDRLREHRNRVVHHFRHVVEGTTPRMILQSAGAKGHTFGELTVPDVVQLVHHFISWSEFGRQIMLRYTASPPPPPLPPLVAPALPPALAIDWHNP